MEIVNFLRQPAQIESVHGGEGLCRNCRVLGLYSMNGEAASVEAGDVLINKPFAFHFLKNTGDSEMRVLVFEVYNR